MTSRLTTDDQDHIDERASYWVVLASERELNADEQRELNAWRAANPRHERAWQDLSHTWSDIAFMQHLGAIAQPLPTAPAAETFKASDTTQRRRGSPVAARAALAAVLIAAVALSLLFRSHAPQRYETQLAETRLITLPDGSQVTLAPASTLEVRFADEQRRVALTRGEAFFEVVHDATRPFTVEAGGSSVRVLGTKFDVNYTEQSVRVAVLQGKVEVTQSPQNGIGQRATRLIAGQRTELRFGVNAQGPAQLPLAGTAAPAIATFSTPPPGAWREGRLVYDNVRLGDLVSDVNRYYAPGVTMADPTIENLRVTAAFKVSEIPAFVSALDGVIPVIAEERQDGAFRLHGAKR